MRRPWPGRRRRAVRRHGVQALRHLRLPARPDPGRAARQHHVDTRRLRQAAMEGQREMARVTWSGSGQAATWRRGRVRRDGRDRRGGIRPDALLRRERRPGRRPRHISWTGGEGRVVDTQKQAGDLHVHRIEITSGHVGRGRPRSSCLWTPTSCVAPAPTTRRPTCCTRPCAMCSAARHPEGLRWSTPNASASTSATAARSRPRKSSVWRPR
jgi:hypothetical protein